MLRKCKKWINAGYSTVSGHGGEVLDFAPKPVVGLIVCYIHEYKFADNFSVHTKEIKQYSDSVN